MKGNTSPAGKSDYCCNMVMEQPTASKWTGGVLHGRDFKPGIINMVKNSRLGRP